MPQDDAETVRWHRLAAERGYGSAQNKLGVMYAAGRDVPQDCIQAHTWFNVSASRSFGYDRDGAANARDLVADLMTAEQIAEAQRLAREWDAAHPREPLLVR